jgi:hypothetical protein
MPWLHFTADFDWRQPGFTIAYKAGTTKNVTRDCAAAALAKGKAEPADRPQGRVPYGTK